MIRKKRGRRKDKRVKERGRGKKIEGKRKKDNRGQR